jgi:rRNA biogenesis protein RRP5
MQFLACIKEINEFDLVVSLPNNLKGFIKATEISDNLTKLVEAELAAAKANVDDDEESSLPKLHDLVYIGQYVRCVIIKLDESQSTNKRIYLSMRESLLNLKLNSRNINAGQVLSGSISSVEDHGYVVSLGLKDAKGFLLKKNAKNTRPATAAGGSDAALQIGQPVDFIVTGVNKESKTVFLDANRDKIINAAIKSEDIVGIENLRPGMTLKVSVESTLPNGIFVRFLEYFTGTIDVFHLGKPVPQNKLATTFTQGQKLRACIVVVDLENKAISLTLQPHVLSFTPFDPEQNGNGVQIGEIFETAEVSRIDPGIGIALTIPAKTGPLQAYAHVRS